MKSSGKQHFLNEIFLQMAIFYKLLCSPNSANESVVYPDNTGCRLTCASDNQHWPHGKLTISIHSQKCWHLSRLLKYLTIFCNRHLFANGEFFAFWQIPATDIVLQVSIFVKNNFLQMTNVYHFLLSFVGLLGKCTELKTMYFPMDANRFFYSLFYK